MKLYINDETSKLKSVLLGTANNLGDNPKINQTYDPSSIINLKKGTYPTKHSLIEELELYKKTLESNGVNVYSLDNVPDCNQIYARDIGFVIEDCFFISNILPLRIKELNGLNSILKKIDDFKVIKLNSSVHVEGGDIILDNDYIFIGYYGGLDYPNFITARTNINSVEAIKELFPNKIVKSFELKKSNTNPYENALHLDCCFQPIGKGKALIHKEGFLNCSELRFIENLFGKDNLFYTTKIEMTSMNCNVVSISEHVVVSERSFTRLNQWLRLQGFIVEEVAYSEISKQGGLFRCSTMPLIRA